MAETCELTTKFIILTTAYEEKETLVEIIVIDK